MINKMLYYFDDFISSIALVLVIFLTGINVILRYVFNSPISWTMEIAIALFIWFVFIGISSTMKRGGHIGVDYFVKKLPRPLIVISRIIRIIAIYFVLLYVFFYLGLKFTMAASGKLTPILGLSYQYIDIAVPIGGVLTAIHFTIQILKGEKNEALEDGGDV